MEIADHLRYYSILKKPWNFIFSFFLIRVFQTPAAVALILCIIGATSADDPSTIPRQGALRAGVVLFAVLAIALCLLALGAVVGLNSTGRGEKAILLGICLSLPFLLVRVSYALLGCFGGSEFNVVEGSAGVDLGMAVLEEMVVVFIYLWVGMHNPSVPADFEEASGASRTERIRYRAGRGDFGGGKLGLIGLLTATLGWLGDITSGRHKQELQDER